LEDIMASTTTSRQVRWYAVAAVAVVITGVAVAIPRLTSDSGVDDPVAAPPLELSLGEGDSLASCLAFDVANLAPMAVAFEGTVTAIDGESVTLTVDRWFKGGDASEVTLDAPAGMEALIGGIDFVEGDQYLITAEAGTVNYCGFSGPSTPEMRAAFEQAFPG
jgi:hypothetical protein